MAMFAGMVRQLDQPPVFATAKFPIGALPGLSSTTFTSPLTPPAAPEATRASNWLEPEPKSMPLYSRYSPLLSCATWLPSTPAGFESPAAGVTVTPPCEALKQSAEMFDVAVVVQDGPPPPPPPPVDDGLDDGDGEAEAEADGLGEVVAPVVS